MVTPDVIALISFRIRQLVLFPQKNRTASVQNATDEPQLAVEKIRQKIRPRKILPGHRCQCTRRSSATAHEARAILHARARLIISRRARTHYPTANATSGAAPQVFEPRPLYIYRPVITNHYRRIQLPTSHVNVHVHSAGACAQHRRHAKSNIE